MSEILKALGLTPPAIAIIIALGGLVWWGVKKLIAYFEKERQEIKQDLKDIKNDLKEVKAEDIKQNKGLVQVIYHQCLTEAIKWKEKGYIDSSAKVQFNHQWNKYEELGDGLGHEPKEIIDKLEIRI